jgi:predicted Fe-Mo cluster-binding NifX family protein
MGGTEKPSEQVALSGAEVVVCSGMGGRARSMLESKGIETFVGAGGNVSHAVDMWRAGKLERASEQNACRDHRH